MINRRKALRDFAYLATVGIFVPRSLAQVYLPHRRKAFLSAGSASCPADANPDVQEATNSNDDELNWGQSATNFSVGQGNYSDATTRTICKVGFFSKKGAGTTTSKTHVVKIYTMTGSALTAVITDGTSDERTGDNSAAFSWLYYSWSANKPSMTGGTTYAFVQETTSAVDAANYFITQAPLRTTISGNKMAWNSSGVAQIDSATYEMNIKIYWYD